MNRLQQDLAFDSLVASPPEQLEIAQSGPDTTSPTRCFLPLHYEPNYAYPLFVWLHGPGGSEAEINHVMPHVSLRNYVGIAPRGSIAWDASRFGREAFSWEQSRDCIHEAYEQVFDCIDLAKSKFNIASDRVFLIGNDVGGSMALRVAMMSPQSFAGVVSLGAGLPSHSEPLTGIQYARDLPVMLAHCRDSQVYDTDAVCGDLRLFHSAGMKVWLRQYPCEQEVTTKMLSDVNAWIMERVVGPTTDSDTEPTSTARLEDLN